MDETALPGMVLRLRKTAAPNTAGGETGVWAHKQSNDDDLRGGSTGASDRRAVGGAAVHGLRGNIDIMVVFGVGGVRGFPFEVRQCFGDIVFGEL